MIRILNARAQINHLNRAIKEAFRKTAKLSYTYQLTSSKITKAVA
jgi:hypothetical protein